MNVSQPFDFNVFRAALELYGIQTASSYEKLKKEPRGEGEWVVVTFSNDRLIEDPDPQIRGKGTWSFCPRQLLLFIDSLSFRWREVEFSHISRADFARGEVLQLFGDKAELLWKASTSGLSDPAAPQAFMRFMRINSTGAKPFIASVSIVEENAVRDAELWNLSFQSATTESVVFDRRLVELLFASWDRRER